MRLLLSGKELNCVGSAKQSF